MYNKKALCDRMKHLLPDMGECGIDFKVDWDTENNKWRVILWKDEEKLSLLVDESEADLCMENKACAGLLGEIAQFKASVVSSENS